MALVSTNPESSPDVECIACYAASNPSPEKALKVACLIGVATGVRFGSKVPLCKDCLLDLRTLKSGLSEGMNEN